MTQLRWDVVGAVAILLIGFVPILPRLVRLAFVLWASTTLLMLAHGTQHHGPGDWEIDRALMGVRWLALGVWALWLVQALRLRLAGVHPLDQ